MAMIGTSARQVANRIIQLRTDLGFYIEAAIEFMNEAPTEAARQRREQRFKQAFPKIEILVIDRIGRTQYVQLMPDKDDLLHFLDQFNEQFGGIILESYEVPIVMKCCDAQIGTDS